MMGEIQINKTLGYKDVGIVQEVIGKNELADFFSFPEIVLTFGYAKKSTKPVLLRFNDFDWLVRLDKTQAHLLKWVGPITKTNYDIGIEYLKSIGYCKFGSMLSFDDLASIDKENTVKLDTWMSRYSVENHPDMSGKKRHNIRNAMKKFEFVLIQNQADISAAIYVLDDWYNLVRDKYFMISYGHYATVIQAQPFLPNSKLFLLKKDGKPVGLIGGYIDESSKTAVTIEAKHIYCDSYIGDALWGHWLHYIHDIAGCGLCNNGDTADTIKQKFGMEKKRAVRIKKHEIAKDAKLIVKNAIEVY